MRNREFDWSGKVRGEQKVDRKSGKDEKILIPDMATEVKYGSY